MKMKTIMENFRRKMQEADSEYEAKTEADYIERIRDFSQELTGRRDTYGAYEKIEHMSIAQLKDYYEGMFDSPEAQALRDEEQRDADAKLGRDTEFDSMPKQAGMGRGLEEKNYIKGKPSND